jgi:hypothetical protein
MQWTHNLCLVCNISFSRTWENTNKQKKITFVTEPEYSVIPKGETSWRVFVTRGYEYAVRLEIRPQTFRKCKHGSYTYIPGTFISQSNIRPFYGHNACFMYHLPWYLGTLHFGGGEGASCNVVGKAPQAGRSWDRYPMRWMNSFNLPNPSGRSSPGVYSSCNRNEYQKLKTVAGHSYIPLYPLKLAVARTV